MISISKQKVNKRSFFYFILFSFISYLFLISFKYGIILDNSFSEMDRISDNFLVKEGKILEKKYHMKQSAIGGGERNDKLWLIKIEFDRFGPKLTEQESRQLIVNCVTDLLNAINQDEKLTPFLEVHPFTSKNISFIIINYDPDGNSVFDPYSEVISCSESKLSYLTKDRSKKYGYKTKKYETFDEAIAILKNEKNEVISK